jgi:hypothetical protein
MGTPSITIRIVAHRRRYKKQGGRRGARPGFGECQRHGGATSKEDLAAGTTQGERF